MGVVVRRYIDFLILLIPTSLVSVLFCSSIPTFCSFFKMFFVLVYYRHGCIYLTRSSLRSHITGKCYSIERAKVAASGIAQCSKFGL